MRLADVDSRRQANATGARDFARGQPTTRSGVRALTAIAGSGAPGACDAGLARAPLRVNVPSRANRRPLATVTLVLGMGLATCLFAMSPGRADAHANRQESAPHAPARVSAAQQFPRVFNRSYQKCLDSTSATPALKFMQLASRYRKRLSEVNGQAKLKKCATFELRFYTLVTTTSPPNFTSRHVLQAQAPLHWTGIYNSDLRFRASGPLEYKEYDFSGSLTWPGDPVAGYPDCVSPYEEAGTKGSMFRVFSGGIYTGPRKRPLGNVRQLILDPGTPANLVQWGDCPILADKGPGEAQTWHDVWSFNHLEERQDTDIDGPWELAELPRHLRDNGPETLMRHDWLFDVDDGDGYTTSERTTLAIDRVN